MIDGMVPRPESRPCGCAFHPRCRLTRELAAEEKPEKTIKSEPDETIVLRSCVEIIGVAGTDRPELRPVGPEHLAACHEYTTYFS